MNNEEKPESRLFSQLFNQLDLHDQIEVLRLLDDLTQAQERREKAVVDIRDFRRKEKQ